MKATIIHAPLSAARALLLIFHMDTLIDLLSNQNGNNGLYFAQNMCTTGSVSQESLRARWQCFHYRNYHNFDDNLH